MKGSGVRVPASALGFRPLGKREGNAGGNAVHTIGYMTASPPAQPFYGVSYQGSVVGSIGASGVLGMAKAEVRSYSAAESSHDQAHTQPLEAVETFSVTIPALYALYTVGGKLLTRERPLPRRWSGEA